MLPPFTMILDITLVTQQEAGDKHNKVCIVINHIEKSEYNFFVQSIIKIRIF